MNVCLRHSLRRMLIPLSILLGSITIKAQCEGDPYGALMNFYESTNGGSWSNNSNWGENCDVCSWYGINCDVSGNIISISLSRNNLRGTLPDIFHLLPSLKTLSLSRNEITGEIPFSITSCEELQVLNLGNNEMTGKIYNQIVSLPSIRHVYLHSNRFSGSIPISKTISNLQILYIQNNNLTGNIPPQAGNFSKLSEFLFSNNKISGLLPKEIGDCLSLRKLYGNQNELEGPLPAEVCNLYNLRELFLQDNHLSGSIPGNIGNLWSLWQLSLKNNQLSGQLPESLGQISTLRSLDMSGNNLTGCYPQSYINLCQFQNAFRDNCLNMDFHYLCQGESCDPEAFIHIESSLGETICGSQEVNLSVNSYLDGLVYEWSTGQKSSAFDQITVVPGSSSQYAVTVTTGNGCSFTDQIEITVKESTIIEIDTFICPGENLEWNNHLFKDAGFYEVLLESQDGCQVLAHVNVDFYESNPVSIQGNESACFGEALELGVEKEGEILWNNGSTEKNILVSETGWYSVELKNNLGCISYDSLEVTFSEAPQISEISVVHPNGCSKIGGTIEIELTGTGLSSIDGGNSWSSTHIYEGLGDGQYIVNVASVDTVCVSHNPTIVELEIDSAIILDTIRYTNNTDCEGNNGIIEFIAFSEIGRIEYSINGGKNWYASPKFYGLPGGEYDPMIKISDSDCDINRLDPIWIKDPLKIEVDSIRSIPPECIGDHNGKATICVKDEEVIKNVIWSDGQSGLSVSGLEAGNYTATLTSVDGCRLVIPVDIPTPKEINYKSHLPLDTTLCYGIPLVFEKLDDRLHYTWYNSEGYIGEGDSIEIGSNGMVYLEVSDGRSCFVEDSIYVEVIEEDNTGVDFLLGKEGVVGVPMVLVDDSWPEVEQVSWVFSDSNVLILDQLENQIIVEFLDTGTYQVTMVVEEGFCPHYVNKKIHIVEDVNQLSDPQGLETFIQEFKLFPNPNFGIFSTRVGLKDHDSILLTIINSMGKMVWQQNFHNHNLYTTLINIENEPPGIYTIIVQSNMASSYINFYKN